MPSIKCDYCQQPAPLVDNKIIYGRSFGKSYYCQECGAWVGVHEGTVRPMGRMANAHLRRWKMKAHAAFDPIWQLKSMQRSRAYLWLSKELGIERKDCHIGKFDADLCQLTVSVCNEYREN